MLRVLDLFAGIGGFSAGLEETGGFETVAFVENDEWCQGRLKRIWPEVPVYGDIKDLTPAKLRADGIRPDVVVGGPPCQPVSLAGKRKFQEDDRWLWHEMVRIIRGTRPDWVVYENPLGILTMGIENVLADLEGAEYRCGPPFVIPAAAVNAPHIRDRVWVVAHTARVDAQRRRKRRKCEDGAGGAGKDLQEKRSRRGRSLQSKASGLVKLPERASLFAGYDGIESPFEPGSAIPQPLIRRVDDGFSTRMDRNKALGNAIVPQIPEEIGRTILIVEEKLKAT